MYETNFNLKLSQGYTNVLIYNITQYMLYNKLFKGILLNNKAF